MDRRRVGIAVCVLVVIGAAGAVMAILPRVFADTVLFRWMPVWLNVGLGGFVGVAGLYGSARMLVFLARSRPLLAVSHSGFTDLSWPLRSRTLAWSDVASVTVAPGGYGGDQVRVDRRTGRKSWVIDARLLARPYQDPDTLRVTLDRFRTQSSGQF